MNMELIKLAKKAAASWKGTDTYNQAATIINMLIDELNNNEVEDAEWINEGNLLPKCSACGEYSDDALNRGGNFCHNCGRRMSNAR